jgi:hypothetical protein
MDFVFLLLGGLLWSATALMVIGLERLNPPPKGQP